MKSFATAAVLLVPLALASCGDDGAGPERREAESITLNAAEFELNDGDTIQIVASVFDQNDDVFEDLPDDVEISWSSANTAVLSVLPDGRAIGVAPGVTTVRASVGGGVFADAPVSVIAVPTELAVVAGNTQIGLPTQTLADSVVFRVRDRHGNGVAGVAVAVAVIAGGGSVSPASAITDTQGRVRVQWTLGPLVGPQSIEATIAGFPATVVNASMAPMVAAGVDVPTTVSVGGTLPGTISLDATTFPSAIGAAHVVVNWDPTKLQLQGGSVTSGDFDRSVRWFDNAAGELHVISSDPQMTARDIAAAGLVFDVVGGAGTSTTISLDVEQLVGVNFNIATGSAFTSDVVVTIN